MHDKEFTDCFQLNQNLLTTEPILAYKTFELITDTFNYAIHYRLYILTKINY